eukprot:TRINITY_DN8459_c0_g1_i1.p1 TRINITY_DN8459_c0_g1~~TRINITY_DN8459_c0_g1_i1.p1  ORF type:complete len:407 (+),score=204.34 TRINITY_DN8459_c0_g1_i1:89-1222(+)
MAPKKRTAAMDRSPAGKKAKKGQGKAPEVQAVVEAVQLSDDLGPDCKQMLLATMPFSLELSVEERVGIQVKLVENLGAVMESVQAQLKKAAEDAAAAMVEKQGSKGKLDQDLEQAAAAQKEAEAAAAAKAEALTEKTAAEKAAKTALSQKQKEQKEGDAEVAKAGKDKVAYEDLVAKELVMLRDGTWEKKAEATAAQKHLTKLAAPLKIDESLMKTAPAVLVKQPSERGEFEKLAVTSIEEALKKKVEALTKLVDEAEPSKAARQAAVAEAQKALEEATAAKDAAQGELKEAKAAASEKAEALEAAKHAVEDFVPAVKRAADAKDAAEEKAANFASHHMACFAKLRDRSSKVEEPPLPPPAAEEAQPEEAPAPAAAD